MEGSCNEQGGDSRGNDWRTQHEPDLRRKVIFAVVKKLKISFHQHSENDIKNMTFRIEDKIYGMAKDKDDYLRRLSRKVLALNQGQSLSTSLPYTQTPTSQQWMLPQKNIQSNLNSPESSSGLPTQVPTTTVSAAQNLNIQMSEEEGVHSDLHPHHTALTIIEQSSPQSSALSSLPPSSGQPNSQMAVPFHEQIQPEHENLIITQLMNGQQNHLTSPQNKGEEQEQTPRVSTSQQNNMACFNVQYGPSLLGSTDQGQELEQSQRSGDDDDWREETYHKIKALKEKYVLVLSTLFQPFSDKLREIYSLSQRNMPHDLPVEWVKGRKETLERVLEFLNVCQSSVSEFHRDSFSLYERKVLRLNELHQNLTRRSMQKQQQKQKQVYQQPQTNQLQIPENEWNDIQSSSPESLAQSVSEMSSVISLTDRFAGSVHYTRGSRFRLQQGDTNPTKRYKRSVTAIPLDSTASSSSEVNKIEPSYVLLQEIIEINERLEETVVSICNEDVCQSEVTSGLTVLTVSYVPVSLSATFKAHYNSGHIIQPLRLLVPESYPYSPIIILEKILLETASVHKHEDLSARARSRFGLSMRQYSGAMSLTEIAKVWDECARATMLEYADRHALWRHFQLQVWSLGVCTKIFMRSNY